MTTVILNIQKSTTHTIPVLFHIIDSITTTVETKRATYRYLPYCVGTLVVLRKQRI
jgi:hypothetical protein